MKIFNILEYKNKTIFVGKKFGIYEPLYTYPYSSVDLNIYVLKNLSDNVSTSSINEVNG